MNNLFRFSAAAVTIAIATMDGIMAYNSTSYDEVPLEEDPAYNPNEKLGSFDIIVKPYPLPIKTTTYTNFYFNVPEDLPDHFHMVFGEVINSQPLHLHHSVLMGCPGKVDPSIEGMPFEEAITKDYVKDSVEETQGPNVTCTIPIGGWAPGRSVLGVADIETGVLMGRSLGIHSMQLNIHYTDGAYEDPEAMTPKLATDGIRFYYTPVFRPYSTASVPIIAIGAGPGQLAIPPGESRFFVTRTCKVVRNCADATTEQIQTIIYYMSSLGFSAADLGTFLPDMDLSSDISCQTLQPLCMIPGEMGSQLKQLCSATCGLCEESTPDKVNPFTPESYRISSINYHAHLLGREMYTTLLREESNEDLDTEATAAVQKEAPISTMTATDIESRPFWIFDYQETIPLTYDIVKEDSSVMRGMEIKPGDKIQTACVYDSTYREEATQFERSTYDEMCVTSVYVTFETPESLVTGSDDGVVDINTELQLLSFSCHEDEESDVYTGTLAEDEDGRDIWKDHPIADAEGCTFPNMKFGPFSTIDFSTRNCPAMGGNNIVCGDLEMNPNANAGAFCTGGTYDQADSNTGTTMKQCVEGGGVYTPYSCSGINDWLVNEAEANGVDSATAAYLIEDWYKPRCCGSDASSSSEVPEKEEEDEEKLDVSVCGDLEMTPDANAGATCTGGTYDQQDANTGTTEKACVDGGGVYVPYTCLEVENYLNDETTLLDSSTSAYLIEIWWKPSCCGSDASSSSSEIPEKEEEDEEKLEEDIEEEEKEVTIVVSGASHFVGSAATVLALLSAVVAMSLL